ncbi:MAG: ribosomal protein L7/L12 [Polaromonas sp.]|nr:ribosomal protein L7/L12 [Polaromonas sp.]
MTTLPAAAIAAIERGDLIVAIKLVREHTGLGLKESKDLVDRYQRGDRSFDTVTFAATPDRFTGTRTVPAGSLPPDAIEAMRRGNKLEAIKLARDAHPGLGLAEAKDLVEAHAEGRSPSLQGGFPARPAQVSVHTDPMAEPGRVPRGQWRTPLFWIALVLLAGFGIWSFMARR